MNRLTAMTFTAAAALLLLSGCLETDIAINPDALGTDIGMIPPGCIGAGCVGEQQCVQTPDGSCVECEDDAGCPSGVCHPEKGECVSCYEDSHCAAGVLCHPISLVCVECYSDEHCPDGVCSADNTCIGCIDDGDCGPNKTCDTALGKCVDENGCSEVNCAEPATPTDLDGDGCNDACVCPDGNMPAPDGTCDECAPVNCVPGATPVDADGDGCEDDCMCADGTPPGPNGCEPCVPIDCPPETKPVDTDGDGCADTCKGDLPCGENGSCDDGDPCTEDICADDGTCQHVLIPDCNPCDITPGVEPYCPAGQPAYDEQGCFTHCECYPNADPVPFIPIDCYPCMSDEDCAIDMCTKGTCINQVCELFTIPDCCDVSIVCSGGLLPVDTDGDGCADTCVCPDTGQPPGPDGCGGICVPISCGPGQVAKDMNNDGCPDTCLCPDGSPPSEDGTCPCVDSTNLPCPDDSQPVDANGDGCVDWCMCKSGVVVLPGESCPCDVAIVCAPGMTPIDTDGDGCDDTCVCQGSNCGICNTDIDCDDGEYCTIDKCVQGACTHTNVCCTPIACLPGLVPVDKDGDGCDDSCVCPDGTEPVNGQCGCSMVIFCGPGTDPVDTTGDGCADSCLTPCQGACDCYDAGLQFQTPCELDCMNCGNFWSCSGGHCMEQCGWIPDDVMNCQVSDQELCVDTGGTWDPFACGHYNCGMPNPCLAIIPGCNCGPEMNFVDGVGCQPDPACQGCGTIIVCANGMKPVDTDGDGCADTCVCPDGTPPGPDGTCPCEPIVCSPGTVATDTNFDGCPDQCLSPCVDTCDCYEQGLEFQNICTMMCPTCDNYWQCVQGLCHEGCGPVPPESSQCTGGPVSCWSDIDCADDEFCKMPAGQCGGIWYIVFPYFPGVCTVPPTGCDLSYDPVCGCDNKTYSNECAADAAGMSIAYYGACI